MKLKRCLLRLAESPDQMSPLQVITASELKSYVVKGACLCLKIFWILKAYILQCTLYLPQLEKENSLL